MMTNVMSLFVRRKSYVNSPNTNGVMSQNGSFNEPAKTVFQIIGLNNHCSVLTCDFLNSLFMFSNFCLSSFYHLSSTLINLFLEFLQRMLRWRISPQVVRMRQKTIFSHRHSQLFLSKFFPCKLVRMYTTHQNTPSSVSTYVHTIIR